MTPDAIPQWWREAYAKHVEEFKCSNKRQISELRLRSRLRLMGFDNANLEIEIKYIKENS